MSYGLLTALEVAEILSVDDSTVLKWFHLGKIPGVILNRGQRRTCVRFRAEDIQRFISERLISEEQNG